ncbi:3-phosphoshikimate 1-carboxyvinyltransferase [Petrotoga sp. 9PW.55.5.1]|uniref:3-phosphoshikimate 1-carboxyvinyltransferase n=1 Tax=Petrotoga sp. 9PW.55.5.1 TaxID=1308979 RepID=UPI000DC452E2|nr:3-phosphoshikimate 1-carboxyvinyltransferase [Petrotoga sp. 9PW.55.5.1]RAO99030.1 3-phosphoshikimate 1-carboxyvinyltransferase [Petrotoga sp. 9PW.55.5.1]
MKIEAVPIKSINTEITVPGDKSISHRGLILGSLANGETRIHNFLTSEDTLATLEILKSIGANITQVSKNEIIVRGNGLNSFREPFDVLNAKNSGTTTRLLMGVLAAQKFYSVITGDDSLKKRPMKRVIDPLSKMGGRFFGRKGGENLPITILGTDKVVPITYETPVASAQVKSSIILAGLHAKGKTMVKEPAKSRDHTERMLKYMGADVVEKEKTTIISGPANNLKGKDIFVPGDISSASFFIVAALITKNSNLLIKDVGLNPTRTGILDVLKMMGAEISIINERNLNNEPIGDLLVKSSKLKGVEISGDMIPSLIDEIPIISILATQAEGKTTIKDAKELRYKETDRIKAICSELTKLGIEITEKDDGFDIIGKQKIKGNCTCNSYNDHRIAMSLAIAGTIAENPIKIQNFECVNISFPEFLSIYKSLKS